MDVYIVDPDISEILYVRDCLRSTEFTSNGFHHGLFLGAVDAPVIALISLEQELFNGLTYCKQLRNSNPKARLILTSTLDISIFEDKILEIADMVLCKPYCRTELLSCLRNLSTTKDLSESP